MKRFRNLTALLLSLILILGIIPSANAAGTISIQETYINPLYEELVSEQDLNPLGIPWTTRSSAQNYFSDTKAAGAYLREAMTLRQDTIAIPYMTDGYDGNAETIRALLRDIAAEALLHTGVPDEGDYLMWQFAGWNASAEASVSGGIYYWTFTYTYTYYTTAEEEALVTENVNEVLQALDVSDSSEYRKVRAVYDYICANVTYDYDHLDTPEYKHQFTAYAALIDGTAVCQGYALLFYRLALELGIDARLISGTSRNQPHGWNIAKLGNLYYNLDSTWDAGDAEYDYFLRSPATFAGHTRDAEYETPAFHAEYPMAGRDYVPTPMDTCDHSYELLVTEPTCLEDGLVSYHCAGCGHSYVGDVLPAPGHSWDAGQIIQSPTDTEPGTKRYSCTKCDATKTQTIPAIGNVYRIYGENRYQTAIKVAETVKEIHGVEKFSVILVASGTDFADALSGSYLAGKHNAPLLLVNKYTISLVAEYIRENLTEDGLVYLLGGNVAVPEEMEAALDGLNVVRLQGSNRYETNLAILREAGIDDEEILVCTGLDFADSLSASALNRPILLVKNALNDAQKTFLSSLHGNQFCIIGGTNAVNSDIEASLAAFGSTRRIEGANRYETSVNQASAFSPACVQIVTVYGHNFPDGLCGGILASALDAPLILTQDRSKAFAASFTLERDIRSGVVLGGIALVSDETVREIFSMDDTKEIIVR